MNDVNLKGIVTGAGKGIGFSTCKLFLEKNYKIIAITRSKSIKLNNLKNKYKSNLEIYYVDLTKFDAVSSICKVIFKKNKNINFLVNNAGVRFRKSFESTSLNDIMHVFNNNILSQLNLTKNYLLNINKRKNNSIVFISSIVGPKGFKDLSVYAATKGAIESFSRSLAIEYSSKKIRINCISPGFINTSYASNFKRNKKKLYNWTIEKTPMNRWGESNEIANVIDFLVSNKSSYITGENIFVDGGWVAS